MASQQVGQKTGGGVLGEDGQKSAKGRAMRYCGRPGKNAMKKTKRKAKFQVCDCVRD